MKRPFFQTSSRPGLRSAGRSRLGLVAGLALAVLAWPVAALGQTVAWEPAAITNPTLAPRRAIIVASGSDRAEQDARAAALGSYRQTLSGLGFDVLALAGMSRPELDGRLREAAQAMPSGGELAIVVIGPVLARGDELFVVPADAVAGLDADSPALDTEALRLSSVVRRFDGSALRELVVMVEDCRARTDTCPLDSVQAPPKVSGMGQVQRGPARDAFRPAVMTAMMVAGQPFAAFGASLQALGRSRDVAVVVSKAASQTFMFRPPNFFETSSHPCLAIDPAANAQAARAAGVRPAVAACQSAVTRWPSVDVFSQRLVAGLEQVAFQKAIETCSPTAGADAYVSTYPAGRYRGDVEAFLASCRKLEPKPEPKPEPKVEPKVEPKAKTKPAPEVKAKPETKAKAVAQPKSRGPTCESICMNLLQGRGYQIYTKAPGSEFDSCIKRLISRGSQC